MNKLILTVVAAAGLLPTFAKGILDVPVAAPSNRLYLADMPTRLWWNADWKKRAPLLVSNTARASVANAAIDVILDFGEKVDPKSVRVTTPWEVEVPCVAKEVRVESSSPRKDLIQLVFQTELRALENKPFFVYWDNPQAAEKTLLTPLLVEANEDEVRLANGAIDVVFDNRHRTEGLLKSIRIAGSPARNELLWRTTEFAWDGFSFGRGPWSAASVVFDTPLKKTVRFTAKDGMTVDFSLYADSSRIDWSYRGTNGGNFGTHVGVSWAPGGGCAWDDFYYMGSAGKVVTMRAALDHVTDCMRSPEYYGFPWISEGWYALSDRKTRDTVGVIFDRRAAQGFWYLGGGQHSGEMVSFNLQQIRRGAKKDAPPLGGSGAIYAKVGDWKDVKNEHDYLVSPPCVLLGETQAYAPIAAKIPRLDHDFCVNVNVGGWRASKPLPGDEWARNIMHHIRALGANCMLHGQLTDYGWLDLELTKDQYEEFAAFHRDYCEKRGRKATIPEWSPERFDGSRFRKMSGEAHRQGLAVMAWSGAIPGVDGYGNAWDDRTFDIAMKIQALFPKVGQDSVDDHLTGGEGQNLPRDLVKANGGSTAYWLWKNPRDWFDARKKMAEKMRKKYAYSKKIAPDKPVMNFTSDNGELEREMTLTYETGALDTMFNEFVAGMDYTKTKHTAKRLRAFFDNEPGRTIWAHYYFMDVFNYENRIAQTELPFICGINGFSQESITYENFGRDAFEISADFSRLAFHTLMGPKAAKMAPVKNLAVLRDMTCFEEDILKRRYSPRGWWQASQHDLRVNSFAEVYNLNYDVVLNPFFTEDSLKRYKVVYIPNDEVFSEDLAEELKDFVEEGGGAIVEGETAGSNDEMTELELKDGEVKALGKGKIVWTKEILTDKLLKRDPKAIARFYELMAAVGGENPFSVAGSKTLDGQLQSSSEGLFLGVFNRGNAADTGKVSLANQTLEQLKHSNTLFVLDVKSGVRQAYTGAFDIVVAPRQCGFYLIGDDAFTAIPKATEAAWAGPAARVDCPQGAAVLKPADPDFRPAVAVELAGSVITRSKERGIASVRFSYADEEKIPTGLKPFSDKAFSKAIKGAAYLHVAGEMKDSDAVFAAHAEELKDLLKRGGAILFDRQHEFGQNAAKFLKDIGVANPFVGSVYKRKDWDDRYEWNASMPTNHAFVTSVGKKPRHCTGGGGYIRGFANWDKEKQFAPYLSASAPDHAVVVIQDNVCGKGKVVFNSLSRTFNDWYENAAFGDAVLSWFIGLPVEEHLKKTQDFIGGPGEPVK